MKVKIFCGFILSLSYLLSSAQVEFINGDDLLKDRKIRSTLSIGIADMNGDFMDDLILLDKGKDLVLAYQNAPGEVFRIKENGQILENEAWALSLGDLDNDGISELFACGINTFGNVYKKDETGKYIFSQLLFGLTFPQNSNMADINNDGFLDIFICDERAYNDLFLNDGTGQMVYSDFIDMNTVPESNNSGNYGSEWVDFDDDNDLDLFITKCKPGITEADDPLRLNVLFVNDGNNHYLELADEYGLKNGSQSWTGTFGDLDNDGDLDCFVSNHDTTHVIYENINNDTFIDVTAQWSTPLRNSSIQAAIRDFDNNGYNDIYVTGDIDYMYWNKGPANWEIEKNPLGNLNVFTFATGDLNEDGFLDIIASHGILNQAGDYDDVIWLNKMNENHFLKLSLLGEASNRQGIGAKVKLYSDLGIQTSDVKIGESYGTTNSANVHFGLGGVEQVDSIQIYWPSGIIDRYYSISANQHLLAHEAKCLNAFLEIEYEGDNILCAGESIELGVSGDYDSYYWSTGEESSTIQVSADENIYFRGVDENGCTFQSEILRIFSEPDETPAISIVEGDIVNCIDEELTLRSTEAISYLWSTGESSQEITINSSGSYSVQTTGNCSDFYSDTLDLEFFFVETPVLEIDTILLKEIQALQLEAIGNDVFWFKDEFDPEYIANGIFETGMIDQDTAFYVADQKEHFAEVQSVGMIDHMGTTLGGSSLNSGLVFNCWESLIIEEVKVLADVEGFRTIELKQLDIDTGEDSLLYSKQVFVEQGAQYLELGFEVDPGLHYIITTNKDSNLLNFGTKSPGLYRSNQGVSFPYKIENLIELTNSLHGPSYYYYFFDWKVRRKSIKCFSERLKLTILLDTVSALEFTLLENDFNIVPNPAIDFIRILRNNQYKRGNLKIQICDLNGNTISSISYQEAMQINISNLLPGIYLIKLVNVKNELIGWKKLVKKE